MYPIVSKVLSSLLEKNIKNIVLIDNSFRKYSGKEQAYLWVRPNDAHFSTLAHELAGEQLFKYIINNNLIKKSLLRLESQ